MKGRPPKTTAQHKAEGTFRTTRHRNRADANWSPMSPEPPDDLTPAAKQIWRSYMDGCPQEMLASIDGQMLATACQWGAMAYELTTYCAHNILEFEAQKAAARATDKFNALSSKLGMSPVDRARLKAPDPKSLDDDPLDSMLKISAG